MLVNDDEDEGELLSHNNVRRSNRPTKRRNMDDFVRSDTIRMVGERIGPRQPRQHRHDIEDDLEPFGSGITITSPTIVGFHPDFLHKLESWDEEEKKLVSDLRCCGYCGHVEMGGKNLTHSNGFTLKDPPTSYPDDSFPLPPPPAGLANAPLLKYMRKDENNKWLCCSRCASLDVRAKRMKRLVQMPDDYRHMLLGLHVLQSQMLSLIDVSMNFKNRIIRNQPVGMVKGFVNTKQESLLLNNPLIWRGPPTPSEIPQDLRTLAAVMKEKNPVVKKFKMLIEQESDGNCGLAVLPSSAIDDIAREERGRNPLMNQEFDGIVKEASYLVVAGDANHDDTLAKMMRESGGRDLQFSVGEVVDRETRQTVQMSCGSSGLPVKTTPGGVETVLEDETRRVTMQLTLELAIFVALFPEGHGYFDGTGYLNDYLKDVSTVVLCVHVVQAIPQHHVPHPPM